jgi:dTDP-4-dehydrorhamnose 3,5-epimerase
MNIAPTTIADVLVLEPKVFGDARGFFFESFNEQRFREAVPDAPRFVQDNHSRSGRGVLRGLHWQEPPHAQGKLVRVTAGRVDIRRGSPTFGRWAGVELTGENHRQLWIPAGLAHGFLVLSDTADFLYKTTDYYAPPAERCIRWDDPDLAIAWPDAGVTPQVSAKDAQGLRFAELPA